MNRHHIIVIAAMLTCIGGYLLTKRVLQERAHFESYEREAEEPWFPEKRDPCQIIATPSKREKAIQQLLAANEVDGYHFASHAGKVSASNPRQGFSCQFKEDSGSLRLEPLNPRETWSLTMRSADSVPDIDAEDGK